MQAGEDDLLGLIGVNLGAGGGGEVVTTFLGGADLGRELFRLVFERRVAGELFLEQGEEEPGRIVTETFTYTLKLFADGLAPAIVTFKSDQPLDRPMIVRLKRKAL